MSSLNLKTFSNSCLRDYCAKKQNILTPQPRLHTLMQTLLSANQHSARTILVIFINQYMMLHHIILIQQEPIRTSFCYKCTTFITGKVSDEKIIHQQVFARFTTFAIIIIANLCLLQQYKWNPIKTQLPQLIINAPYGSNFITIFDFLISR